MFRGLCSQRCAAVLAALLGTLSFVTAAHAAADWQTTGNIAEDLYDLNCVVLGSQYYENELGVYENEYFDKSALPKVGDVYYLRVNVTMTGNPCGGGDYVHPEVHLPPNTYPAVSANTPIYCLFRDVTGTVYNVPSTQGCPTGLGRAGQYPYPTGYIDLSPNGTASPVTDSSGTLWQLVQGQYIEIRYPVYSTRPHTSGLASDYVVAAVWAANGVNKQNDQQAPSNWSGPPQGWDFATVPQSGAYAGTWVDANPPTVGYPSPSSSSITNTTAHVTGYVYNHFTAGTVYVDIGTAANTYTTSLVVGSVGADANAVQADEDLGSLAAGTTYHWRLRFVPTGGSAVNGADQSFTTTGTPSGSPPPPPTGGGGGTDSSGAPGGGTSAPPPDGGSQSTLPPSQSPSPSPGPAPAPAPSPQPEPQPQEPLASLASIKPLRMRVLLTKGLSTRIKCTATCKLQANLLLDGKTAHRAHLARRRKPRTVSIASARRSLASAGTAVLRLHLSRRVAARLRSQRKLMLTLRVVVTDTAGHHLTLTRSIRVRR